MPTLIEKFDYAVGAGKHVYDQTQYSQSFITPYDCFITSFSMRLWKTEGGNGNARAFLYVADGDGKPSGGYLGVDDVVVTHEAYPGAWYTFDLPISGKISSGAAYVVTLSNSTGSSGDDEIINAASSASETNPKHNKSDDSGSTWNYQGLAEMSFEVWGYPALVGCSVSDTIPVVEGIIKVEHIIPPDPDPVGSSRRIGCLGDPSSHGGVIISTNADGSCHAGGTDVAVHGANHSCPLREHGITPISAIVNKTKHNGKLVLTQDAVAGCGAKIIPPNRGVFVE